MSLIEILKEANHIRVRTTSSKEGVPAEKVANLGFIQNSDNRAPKKAQNESYPDARPLKGQSRRRPSI